MTLNPNEINPEGQVILVDKPLHWTSFDVVKKLKFALKVKKIGHAGTLDPLATGLLILCTGKMTKSIEQYQGQKKEYTGEFTIGYVTDSYDLETEPQNKQLINHISLKDCEQVAKELTGEITQTPPIFSAVKKDGKRAYERARAGEKFELKTRQVLIEAFDIIDFNPPNVSFRIVCSKGTYIRSMANDFGEKLGVGAYLSALRRTKIGDFSVEDAENLLQMVEKQKKDSL